MSFETLELIMSLLAPIAALMIPVGGLAGTLFLLSYKFDIDYNSAGKPIRSKSSLAKGIAFTVIAIVSTFYTCTYDSMVYKTISWGTYAVRHVDGTVTAEQGYIKPPWSRERVVYVREAMTVTARQSYRAIATEPGLRVGLNAVLKFKSKTEAAQSVDWEKPKDPMHNLETEAQNVLAKALATLDSQIFWCIDAIPYCDATNNFGDVARSAIEPFAKQHNLEIKATYADLFRETIY